MRKIIVLFCLLVSFIANAESFKYMYGGNKNSNPLTYTKLNQQPVILNFLSDLKAIQLVLEGESIMFYIADAYEEGDKVIAETVMSDGRKALFSITDEMTVFKVSDITYVITDIPKSLW